MDLSSQERQQKLLALVSVDDVWGIGSVISKRLHAMSISTALQLADSNSNMMRKSFDVIVGRTVRELIQLILPRFIMTPGDYLSVNKKGERMGLSVPVKIGQKEFKSKKAARDYFMVQCGTVKESGHDP